MRKGSNHFVNGETTVIGAGTVIDGNVKTSTSTRIDGQVNGDVTSDGAIVIGAEGKVTGNVICAELMVAGEVLGNVNSKDKIEISAKGKLIGDIETKSFVVDETAIFQGNCKMLEDGKTE